jgi:hypothetical protein
MGRAEEQMDMIIGPILKQAGGYVFDTWSVGGGVNHGYPYRRIEDANYARNVTIRTRQTENSLCAVVCHTVDEFMARIGCGGVRTAA